MIASENLEDPGEGLSRSARKRGVEALQKMGERLLTLTPAQLATIPLPDELARAVGDALKIKTHGALRRQRQYIGRLMRQVDVEPIGAALEALDQRGGADARQHKRLERWRDRLVSEGTAVLDAALAEFPRAERGILDRLVRQAVADTSPKARRELFRYLREAAAKDILTSDE